MSLLDYTLTHGGETKALKAWGIESAQLTLSCGGEDELSFQLESDITAASPFTPLGEVVLKDPDGVRRFRGVVIPRREGWRLVYRCPGANYYLERAYMTSQFKFWDGAAFSLQTIARYLHGVGNVNTELAAAIAAVNAVAASTVSLDATDVPTYRNPEDIQTAERVIDTVRRVLAWSPFLDYRWNYGSTTPEMRVFSVLRSGHGYGSLPENSIGSESIALGQMQEQPAPVFDPRYDLLKSYLKIYWKSFESSVSDSLGTPVLLWRRETDTATASPSNGSFGGIELTLDLRRDVFNDTATPDTAELSVSNLAQRLGAPWFMLWLDFSFAVKGRLCDFTWAPGKLVSATDADPLFASADSVVQRVTHDLGTGLTQVECGAPRSLGFYDPRLTTRLRNASTAGDVGGQSYGFEPDEEPAIDEETTGTGGTPHPFRILASETPGEVYVLLDSRLALSLDMDDEQAITGLGASFAVALGDYIWLEADIDAEGDITGVAIEHGAAPWGDYPAPVTMDMSDPPVQTTAYQLIGRVVATSVDHPSREVVDGVGSIKQMVTTHLLLCEGCYEGATVLIFVPHHGAE